MLRATGSQGTRTGLLAMAAVVFGLAAAGGACLRSSAAAGPPEGAKTMTISAKRYAKPADTDIRKRLTPLQYEVTQHEATEPPFRNTFWNNHEAGLYVDVVTGEPLFSSVDKFESGTGWPSFTRPVEPGRVLEKSDRSLGMVRTEVTAAGGASFGKLPTLALTSLMMPPPPAHVTYVMPLGVSNRS